MGMLQQIATPKFPYRLFLHNTELLTLLPSIDVRLWHTTARYSYNPPPPIPGCHTRNFRFPDKGQIKERPSSLPYNLPPLNA